MAQLTVESLSREEIEYLRKSYINLFTKAKQELDSLFDLLKKKSEKHPYIKNLNMTPKRKLLMIAKKIVMNIVFSSFTGISPSHLDNSVSDIIRVNKPKTPEEYERLYRNVDIGSLFYSIMSDLNIGINKVLDILNSKDYTEMSRIFKTMLIANDYTLNGSFKIGKNTDYA